MAIAIENAEVKEVQAKDLEAIRSPHYQTVYANLAQAGMSMVDIRLTFSTIQDIDVNKLGIEQQVSIIMTPPFAAAVARLLHNHLEKWNARYTQEVLEAALEPEEEQVEAAAPSDREQ